MGRSRELGWAVLVGTAVLAGCAAPTKQARKVDVQQGVLLEDYSMVSKGEGEEALYAYKAVSADWASYTKVLIAPVLFQKPEEATPEELAELQTLATNFHARLTEELGKDFQVVTAPGPDTIRVETAFFNPEKKSKVGNFLSSFMPIGMAVSVVKNVATGKPTSVGEVSAEAKLTDAESGRLLGVALDRRVGKRYGEGMWESWAEADDAFAYWAKRMRFAACQMRGAPVCQAP